MRRLLLLAAVAGLVVVGASVSAPAATARASLELNPAVGSPTTLSRAKGSGFAASNPEIGDPHILALDQVSGRVLFDTTLPGGVPAGPIVTDGRLILATISGDVLAYHGPDS